MPRVGESHVSSVEPAAFRAAPSIASAANDNHRTHAPWRRFVAVSMAALFAASAILVGLVCIADERFACLIN